MKFFLLALFVAAATASPIPEDSGPVDVVVNGVADGEALDIGHIVDIKLQERADGEVVAASNLLHPFTAVGIAEAAAAAEVSQPELEHAPESAVLPAPAAPEVILESVVLPVPVAPEVVPEAVVLPAPASPEVILESVVLPAPAAPEVVPEAVVLPAPASPEVVPEAVVLPAPAAPEVVPEAVVLPAPVMPEVVPEPVAPVLIPEVSEEIVPVPAAQVGDVFNDGNVQVSLNLPEESSILSTLQSWFNLAVNYVNSSGIQTTEQII